MRLGKLVALVFVGSVAIVLLAALALRSDSVKSQSNVVIKVPQGIVWQYLTEPENREIWMAHVVAAAPMTGDPGVAGSTMLMLVRQEVSGTTLTHRVFVSVVASEPPYLVSYLAEGETADVKTTYQLEETSDGTRVQAESVRQLKSVLAQFMAIFLEPGAQENLDANLEQLKLLIEQAEPGYSFSTSNS